MKILLSCKLTANPLHAETALYRLPPETIVFFCPPPWTRDLYPLICVRVFNLANTYGEDGVHSC